MNVAIIGIGYVGLVTGTCLADFGNQVYCVDVDKTKVNNMNKGIIPIYEPGLEKIFQENLYKKRLHITTNLIEVLYKCRIVFLTLPTSITKSGSIDLSSILDVLLVISKIINDYKVIVNKSTVPVGTADYMKNIFKLNNNLISFDIISNPEFLREGNALHDFMSPDRIIIGSTSNRATKIIKKLYKPFIDLGIPIFIMNEKSAELTKYASNAFLAVKITFMNEIANFCEKIGADIDSVRLGVGSDKRIGSRCLFPGLGYGGSCLSKDIQCLIQSGNNINFSFKILKIIEKVNFLQKRILIPYIKKYLGSLKRKKIAIWGLSFKENTDDIRESSAIIIIKELLYYKANIIAYDPAAMYNVKKILGSQIEYGHNIYEVLNEADILLICTEWEEFKNPNFDLIASKLKNKAIFDGKNLYDVNKLKEKGFYYKSIGKS